MKLSIKAFAILGLLIGSSSCALMMNDKTDEVYISSNPPGADIFIEGMNYGKTPANIRIEAKNSTVILNKEGYGSTQLQIEAWATMKNGACVADTLGSIFMVTLYSVQYSGKCNEFKKKEYLVTIPNNAGGSKGSMMNIGRNPNDMINYYYTPNLMDNNGVSPEQQRYQSEYQKRNQQYPGQQLR